MHKKIILLVEDDYLNRRLTKKVLSENGYTILEAKNTREALEILKNEPVNLAILDINLGKNEQDGITLSTQISENYSVPFIYLTAYETPEIIRQAIITLPYSYLTKPFKNSDLIASVEIAIRRSENSTNFRSKITVKDGEYSVEINVDEINYIVSDKNYLLIHTVDKIFKIRSSIKLIIDELSVSTFVRVHRAYIVNKYKIEKYTTNALVINNFTIPVSKNYKDGINKL